MFMVRQRVFITGGAGFIGSRLAQRLAATCDVTAFDNLHEQAHAGNPENRARLDDAGVRLIMGDVRDGAALAAALATVDPTIVYHLAAETGTGQSFDLPVRYNDVNVMGTAHLIEAVRAKGDQVARVVLAGSRSIYGEGAYVDATGRPVLAQERRPADMDAGDFAVKDAAGNVLIPAPTNATCPVVPASVYASTKLMQEYLLRQAFWGTDVAVGILRLQNVYGPGQSMNNPYTGVLSIFARQIQEGKILDIYEDGDIVRDFVLVDDVVRAFAMMGEADVMPQEILDIGSGEPASILDIARTMLGLFGRDPGDLRITGKFRPGDIRYALADTAPAAAYLGWHPVVSLDAGLRRLTDWSRGAV
jgi:dTDP-L-rhamnose 4-epimerase